MANKVKCRVLKTTRIYDKAYKNGDTVEIQENHLNYYGKNIEVIKKKTQGEKDGSN